LFMKKVLKFQVPEVADWQNKAGLGDRLQIEIKAGEICIQSASEKDGRHSAPWG